MISELWKGTDLLGRRLVLVATNLILIRASEVCLRGVNISFASC